MEHTAINTGLDALRAWIREDHDLEREFEQSLVLFFPAGKPVGKAPHELEQALQRHVEWFCIERESQSLGCRPIEAFASRLGAEFGDEDPRLSLAESRASIFVVTGVQEGQGFWLRDLASFGEFPIQALEGSQLIEEHDILVGRIFPTEEVFHLSRTMGVYRSSELLQAVEGDLNRAREQGPKVLRLAQIELELMFWGGTPVPNAVDPLTTARSFLHEGGLPEAHIDVVFEVLSESPFDPESLVPGASDVLAPILDQLAFETAIDLNPARRHLLLAWQFLDSRRTAGSTSVAGVSHFRKGAAVPDADARRRALEQFEVGRASGGDLEALFKDLEKDLCIEGADAQAGTFEEGVGDPLPDFPGVVAAMVEEFLWERGLDDCCEGAKAGAEAEALRAFGAWAKSIGVFENLGVEDLLRFLTFAVPEGALESSCSNHRRLSIGLLRFVRWADDTHDMNLARDAAPFLRRLSCSLPRISHANATLERASEDSSNSPGELFVVREAADDATLVVSNEHGDERRVELEPELVRYLVREDRLRAKETERGFEVLCCYPPEVAELKNRL